jgi:hypothetical protein
MYYTKTKRYFVKRFTLQKLKGLWPLKAASEYSITMKFVDPSQVTSYYDTDCVVFNLDTAGWIFVKTLTP